MLLRRLHPGCIGVRIELMVTVDVTARHHLEIGGPRSGLGDITGSAGCRSGHFLSSTLTREGVAEMVHGITRVDRAVECRSVP
jgi:hypothetical protein